MLTGLIQISCAIASKNSPLSAYLLTGNSSGSTSHEKFEFLLSLCVSHQLIDPIPDKRCGLNGSTQHPLEVYWQGAQQLKVIRERRFKHEDHPGAGSSSNTDRSHRS
jgi:hypothetical protein